MAGQRDRRKSLLQLFGKFRSHLWIHRFQCLFYLFRNWAFLHKPLHQLAHDVLRIRTASAISGNQKFSAALIALFQRLIRSANIRFHRCKNRIAADQLV